MQGNLCTDLVFLQVICWALCISKEKKIQIILSCASQGGEFFEIVVVRKENVIRIQDDSFDTCKLVLLLSELVC